MAEPLTYRVAIKTPEHGYTVLVENADDRAAAEKVALDTVNAPEAHVVQVEVVGGAA